MIKLDKVKPLVIFKEFARLGITGFGGVLPFARHGIVERNRWLNDLEFAELLSISQILPGGNTVNLAVILGWRLSGTMGAIAAFCGLLVVPSMLALVLAIFYNTLSHLPIIRHMIDGMAAVAAGLMFGTGFRLFEIQPKTMSALFFVTLTFALLGILNCSLIITIIIVIPAALIYTIWQRHNKKL